MAYLLRLTLKPDGVPPNEGWRFQTPTGQGGRFAGSLRMAGRSALSLAWSNRCGGVVLTLPRAGLLGLMAKRFVIREPQDVVQLQEVDVDRLRARHKVAVGRGLRWARMRASVLMVAHTLRMPAEWPAVP